MSILPYINRYAQPTRAVARTSTNDGKRFQNLNYARTLRRIHIEVNQDFNFRFQSMSQTRWDNEHITLQLGLPQLMNNDVQHHQQQKRKFIFCRCELAYS
jgi:hypothetical protein